ncbi:MAG: hypothetical protein M3O50_01280 [Myxococcota bacterium]|nr:hypothetical protein [Myxococcota bacterium]
MQQARPRRPWLWLACVLVGLFAEGRAAAQSTIEQPGERAHYRAELEPHLIGNLFDPPGGGSGAGFGIGGRASFEIVSNGFVPTINDSIAIGVGADFIHYQGVGVRPGTCTRFVQGPANTNVCVEVSRTGGSSTYLFLPAVMQWNFWLARRWSVFGEPGLTVYWSDHGAVGASPAFYVGGRFHITDGVTLTFRLGYPTISLGASILF